jgi:hypothetical protein
MAGFQLTLHGRFWVTPEVSSVVRFWNHLSLFTIVWFGIVIAWILKLWLQAFRCHRALYDLYQADDGSEERLSEAALSVAANMTNSVLFSAGFLTVILFVLFAAAMRR